MKLAKSILHFVLAWIGLTCLLMFAAGVEQRLQQGRWFPLDAGVGVWLPSAVIVISAYLAKRLKTMWYSEGKKTANVLRFLFLWVGLTWTFLALLNPSPWKLSMIVPILGYMVTRLVIVRHAHN